MPPQPKSLTNTVRKHQNSKGALFFAVAWIRGAAVHQPSQMLRVMELFMRFKRGPWTPEPMMASQQLHSVRSDMQRISKDFIKRVRGVEELKSELRKRDKYLSTVELGRDLLAADAMNWLNGKLLLGTCCPRWGQLKPNHHSTQSKRYRIAYRSQRSHEQVMLLTKQTLMIC